MTVLEFGSRTGSFAALAFFGLLFLVLGLAAARSLRTRGATRVTSWSVAGVVFTGSLTLIFVSSLGGFYEIEVARDHVILHHLHPIAVEIPLTGIRDIRAEPAFRGRWRLYLVSGDGKLYQSATWHAQPVREAAAALEKIRESH